MAEDPVLFETRGTIAQITINRPDNRNSMDHETMPAFAESVARARENRDLRCVIITGSGNTFCAGADFKGSMGHDAAMLPHDRVMAVYRPFLLIRDLPMPTIAAMNGHAIGGGFGIALQCDIRVASMGSKFGANFAGLGIHSGMAISYLLPRLVGLPVASELLYTGRLITGEKAAEIGLVNYALPADAVLSKAWALAEEIAACAPAAVRMIKRSVTRGLGWDTEAAAEMEAHNQSRTLDTADAKEGISALLEKREPVFTGK